jgi:hypothetical protein
MDVSYYQWNIDYKWLADEGLDFAAVRIGRGLVPDPRMETHLQGFYNVGIPAWAYYVPDPVNIQNPNMNLDKSFAAMVYWLQNKAFVGIIHDDEIFSYINQSGSKVIFTNTNLSQYYANIANQTVKWLAGAKPFMIYSSVGFIQSYMPAFNDQIIKYDCCMAEYPYPLGDSANVVALNSLADWQVWQDKLDTLYLKKVTNPDGTTSFVTRGPLVPSTCKKDNMIQPSGDHFTHPAVKGITNELSAIDMLLFLGTDNGDGGDSDWDSYIHYTPSTTPVTPIPPTNPTDPDLTALATRVTAVETSVQGLQTWQTKIRNS